MSRWRLDAWRRRSRHVWGADGTGFAWGGDAPGTVSHDGDLAAAIGTLPARTRLDVVAAPGLAVQWVQAAPAGVGSLAELRAVAHARCAQLHGGVPEDWWVAGDWQLRHPFACSALPRATVERLRSVCAARRVALHWHCGWAMALPLAGAAANGWRALRWPSRVTLWNVAAGRIGAMESFAVAPDACADAVDAQVGLHLRLAALAGRDAVAGDWAWVDAMPSQASEGSDARVAAALGIRALGVQP